MGITRTSGRQSEDVYESIRKIHIDDVEILVGAGLTMFEIADRLGVKPASLYRVLLRKGRTDLWLPERMGGSLTQSRKRSA